MCDSSKFKIVFVQTRCRRLCLAKVNKTIISLNLYRTYWLFVIFINSYIVICDLYIFIMHSTNCTCSKNGNVYPKQMFMVIRNVCWYFCHLLSIIHFDWYLTLIFFFWVFILFYSVFWFRIFLIFSKEIFVTVLNSLSSFNICKCAS